MIAQLFCIGGIAAQTELRTKLLGYFDYFLVFAVFNYDRP